jgi:NAD(P)-dependent dehydrogenase (short-subunit alcohol dehydrogenase family)
MDRASHIALVTGANRGIGLEVVHQLARQGMRVVLGARDHAKGERAAQSLAQEGISVFPYQLDVTDQQSIDRLHADVTTDFGRLDILVNNAGILYDTWQQATVADLHVVHTALETNLFGVWRICHAFLPPLAPEPCWPLRQRLQRGRITGTYWEGECPPTVSQKPHSMRSPVSWLLNSQVRAFW